MDEILECKKSNEELKSIEIFGSIEGGDSETERSRSAVETSKRDIGGTITKTTHQDSNIASNTTGGSVRSYSLVRLVLLPLIRFIC